MDQRHFARTKHASRTGAAPDNAVPRVFAAKQALRVVEIVGQLPCFSAI
jgi:hypothetical protein